MTVLSIPAIVILKPVHIDLELAIIIEVHIGNEELCDEPSEPPSFEYSRD